MEASESDYHVITLSVITLSGFNWSMKQTLKAKETDFTPQIPIIPIRVTHLIIFTRAKSNSWKASWLNTKYWSAELYCYASIFTLLIYWRINITFRLPNCVLVPHIGSATVDTRTHMATLTAENIIAGIQGQQMPEQLCWWSLRYFEPKNCDNCVDFLNIFLMNNWVDLFNIFVRTIVFGFRKFYKVNILNQIFWYQKLHHCEIKTIF